MSTFFTPRGATLPPLTPETMPDAFADPSGGKKPWYRRGWFLVLVVVVVVGGASVIADLPHAASRSDQVAQATTLVKSVDADIRTCTYSLRQSEAIFARHQDGTLTPSQRAQVPSLLSQNEQACSFANQSVVDLGTLTLPSGPAGRDLGNMITNVEVWMTSDAVAAMVDMARIIEHPGDASAKDDLAKQEKRLATDRGKADADMRAAEGTLGGSSVPDPALPAAPRS